MAALRVVELRCLPADRFARPDFARIGINGLVTAAAVTAAWNAGLLVGPAINEAIASDECE